MDRVIELRAGGRLIVSAETGPMVGAEIGGRGGRQAALGQVDLQVQPPSQSGLSLVLNTAECLALVSALSAAQAGSLNVDGTFVDDPALYVDRVYPGERPYPGDATSPEALAARRAAGLPDYPVASELQPLPGYPTAREAQGVAATDYSLAPESARVSGEVVETGRTLDSGFPAAPTVDPVLDPRFPHGVPVPVAGEVVEKVDPVPVEAVVDKHAPRVSKPASHRR